MLGQKEPVSQGQKRAAFGGGAAHGAPNRGRAWKTVRARSISHAMELCIEYARERSNMSVERIADRMGIPSHWTIYKWVQEGGIPARLIRPFEAACGAEYVTRYIAASARKLVVDLPTGRRARTADIHAVQQACTEAVGALISFAEGRTNATDVHAALTVAMEHLACERAQIERDAMPEFDFGDDHE